MNRFLTKFALLVLVIAIRTIVEVINDVFGNMKNQQAQSV